VGTVRGGNLRMHYFRVLVRVRDQGERSDIGEVCACADYMALYRAVHDQAAAGLGTELAAELLRPCTPQLAQAIFSLQTASTGLQRPVLRATWQGGRVSLCVEMTTEEVYAATRLHAVDSWVAPSGSLYFKAPLVLQDWITQSDVSETMTQECRAYQRQASAWHDIPLSVSNRIRAVDTEAQFAFLHEHAFRRSGDEAYSGPVCVLAFTPQKLQRAAS